MRLRYGTREEALAFGIPIGPEVKPGERGDCPSCGHWIDVQFGKLCWECQWTQIQKSLVAAHKRRKELDSKAQCKAHS